MNEIAIKSNNCNYSVKFCDNISCVLGDLSCVLDTRYIVDSQVARLYSKMFISFLDEKKIMVIDATENNKTLDGVFRVCSWLQETQATSSSTVVAIGGGIIQDISAFCAHIYFRGIRWQFVPTTLLSMADSCIGAKSSINLNNYKNQLGAFAPPQMIYICPDFCSTLSDDDILSGHGEILKLSIIESETQFDQYRETIQSEGFRSSRLRSLIYSSLLTKKKIIEEDEFDYGIRRILNYGHSIGHAFESLPNNKLPHGIAVALGIDVENYIAYRNGFLDKQTFDEISLFIREHFPSVGPLKLSVDQVINSMRRDKKATSSLIHLAQLYGLGDVRIVPTYFDSSFQEILTSYL